MLTRVSMAPASQGRQLGVLEHRGVCLPRSAGYRRPGLEQASCGSTQAPSALYPCQSGPHRAGPLPPAMWAPLLACPVVALSSYMQAWTCISRPAVRPSLILRPAPAHLIFPHIQPSVCVAPRARAQEGRIEVCWHMVYSSQRVVCVTWAHSHWVSSPHDKGLVLVCWSRPGQGSDPRPLSPT